MSSKHLKYRFSTGLMPTSIISCSQSSSSENVRDSNTNYKTIVKIYEVIVVLYFPNSLQTSLQNLSKKIKPLLYAYPAICRGPLLVRGLASDDYSADMPACCMNSFSWNGITGRFSEIVDPCKTLGSVARRCSKWSLFSGARAFMNNCKISE